MTVWCALWSKGVIGPYCFENDDGPTVTVNSDFFVSAIEEYSLENMWFQQDGATCHPTRASMALLPETFRRRVFSRRGDINWPPRSCDLTPLDFFYGATRWTAFMQLLRN